MRRGQGRQSGGGKKKPLLSDGKRLFSPGDRLGGGRKQVSAARLRRRIVPWLFLAPSLAGVAVFMGFSFLDAVSRSFRDAMGTRFVGLDNYRAVLDNSAFRLAVGNTARFLGVCIPLLLTISLGLALFLTRRAEIYEKLPAGSGGVDRKKNRFRPSDIDGKRNRPGPGGRDRKGNRNGDRGRNRDRGGCGLIRTTLVLPMAIPAASMVLIWKILLCQEGVLNQTLSGLTGNVWEVDWAFSRWAFPVLVATYLWKHTGYDMILWLAGLQGIPGDLYEAARIDGAGSWQELRYITLPQLKGTLWLVGILSLVNSFRVYREAYLLAGSYPDSSIYLIPHLLAHWFLNLDIQKMTAAAVMMTGAFLTPVLFGSVWRKWRRRR